MQSFDFLLENATLANFYYYSKLFNNDEIERILSLSKKYTKVEGNVSGTVNHDYRNSTIVWIPVNDETKWLYEKIIEYMKKANSDMWKFHITQMKDPLQVSEYIGSSLPEKAGHYDWHMDMGQGSSTRKISFSIQLTDETTYEGGDLELMIHRSIIKAPREKGTLIFFPSYLTHRVTKVTKGTRHSLVCWFHGPPFV